MNDEKVMHKHRQSNLPLRATSATAGKLTHRTMLLEVGKAQFHRLTAESVECFRLRRSHTRSVGLDQRLVFAAFDGSAAVRIGTARDLPGTRPTMLRRTTITMHHVDLPVALPSFLMADPRHRMALRATIHVLLRNPGEVFLPDRTRLRALLLFLLRKIVLLPRAVQRDSRLVADRKIARRHIAGVDKHGLRFHARPVRNPFQHRAECSRVGRLGEHLIAQAQLRVQVANQLHVVQRSEDVVFVASQAPPRFSTFLDPGSSIMSLSVSHKDVTNTRPNAKGQGSSAFERWLCRGLLKSLGNPSIKMILWDGEEIGPANDPPVASMIIGDRSTLRRLIIDPVFQFGESYSNRCLEIEGNLLEFLETIYRSQMGSNLNGSSLQRLLSRFIHAQRSNSITDSRENIHHHYDINSDFYRLWLDDEMIYSCAYFAREDMSLAEAQLAKLDYVCRKLWLKPGENVVDVGGGWGGLAIFMAKRYGVNVKAFNISKQQIDFARHRTKAEDLDGKVEFIDDDYRNINGRFDALVSLGMLEHVGKDHYRDFGRMADRCLASHGRGLIQTIAQNQPIGNNAWIQRRIFPGGYIPTLREMTDIVEPYNFSVLDLENLRLHYAKTLEHWLQRFEDSVDRIRKMFDDRFVRMWRLYLSGSCASFSSGSLQLYQFLFARPSLNEAPRTREHLYNGYKD